MRRIVLSVFIVVVAVLISPAGTGASNNDSVYSYLALSQDVTHNFQNYTRETVPGSNPTIYLNTWEDENTPGNGLRSNTYSYYKDPANNYWTFEREQTNGLPPGGVYTERYVFQNQANPAASTWVYLNQASMPGDINNNGNASQCAAGNFSKCDDVLIAGQFWLKNLTASPSQGGSSSPAIASFDSSTTGAGRAHFWRVNGSIKKTSQYTLGAQMWKRNNWNTSVLASYAAAVNTTPGWTDPPVPTNLSINPKFVYIVRQYSGCESTMNPAEPHKKCDVFEDHVYAKDANNNQLAEVLVVTGLAPGYNTAWLPNSYFAVTGVFVAKN